MVHEPVEITDTTSMAELAIEHPAVLPVPDTA